MPKVNVTDNAVLRYLERHGGFDIEGLRQSIADRIAGLIIEDTAALYVQADGFRWPLVRDEAGTLSVVTCLPYSVAVHSPRVA